MYAERKGLPLEGVRVAVTHERNHQHECDHVHAMETGEKMQALHRTITILGDGLSDEDRAKLIEIADKCPVHRTLEGNLHVHTESIGRNGER